MSQQPPKDFTILIIGAGPSGLLLALLLARKGINVIVLEKSQEFSNQPRASFYSAPSIHAMKRAGIMPEIYQQGYLPTGMCWRYLDGTRITGIDATKLPMEMRQVSLPLDRLIPLIAEHLSRCPSAEVLMEHEVMEIGQNEMEAWVDVSAPDGSKRFSATYIVGCDGGSSKIRSSLFGSSFPGKTWSTQIIATNVYYPRFRNFNWPSSNFFLSPDHTAMVAQMTNDGLLRITYGEDGSLSYEELRKRQPEKFKAFVPGVPEPEEYEIVNFSPYRIHQRCAEKIRVGRFLLAADAAHLCNPYGGMGLTGGFADIDGLYDCLYGIWTGQADESILDKYGEIRREKYWNVIDPASSGNIQRLWEDRPEVVEKDEFFNALKRAEEDASGEMMHEMLKGVNAVMHDFTQYYKDPLATAEASINSEKKPAKDF